MAPHAVVAAVAAVAAVAGTAVTATEDSETGRGLTGWRPDGSSLSAGDPITCQPFKTKPHLPIYHIIGHVSASLDVEQINDCSGVVKYKGLYHVFHQCCQNHWDHVVSRDLAKFVHPGKRFKT